MYSAVVLSFSSNRMQKYEDEFVALPNLEKQSRAVDLYFLNIDVSSLFLAISGVYEVLLRNAVIEVVEQRYGDRWVLKDDSFFRSIRRTRGRKKFCPKAHLASVIENNGEVKGQIISNLKFVFWEFLLSSYQNDRLWRDFLKNSFPHYEGDFESLRELLHSHIKDVREIRNRAAHHEPIYHRSDLGAVVDRVFEVIGYRSLDLLERVEPKKLKMQGYLDLIHKKRQIA